jgi:uncharacterized membrane protein
VAAVPQTGVGLIAGIIAYLANQSKLWALLMGVLGYVGGVFGIGSGLLPASQTEPPVNPLHAEVEKLKEAVTEATSKAVAAQQARTSAEAAAIALEKARKDAVSRAEKAEKAELQAKADMAAAAAASALAAVPTIDPVPQKSNVVIDPVPPKPVRTVVKKAAVKKPEPEPAPAPVPAKPVCDPMGSLAQGRLPTC